ncbi:unnamed protein product [Rotaria socialis]|uniref:Equilibrative nucleoside transporter 1 n=1 Tax=Rotaria socialis TaxID=392032 RepID=A0A821BKF7_9BILA|nr:unnamed protein product [Rotaria socialis]CAF3290608.1 unnamed protein product [Rotaria socialis]CAF3392611.1 unnamed protein product [Rotaria socialis]CAF3756851.1 unnamed protein product [Rotaria socialis]CAF3798675.1 unnamed protein product [Rotaria socialis]
MDSPSHSPRVSTTSVPLVLAVDGHSWSYWAFVWLGLGSLLPFNFFITADPYFRYKLHDSKTPNSSASRLELSYENAVTLSVSVPNLIATILVTFVCVPYIHKYRIYSSLSGIAICLLICFAFIFVNVNQWREIFFIVTMGLVMIQGVLCAILLNCFFSLASTLPSRYIQGFVAGQALGGVFVVLCSIASILFSNDISVSAAIYFLLALFVIASNLLTYIYVEKSHLLQIYSSSIQEVNNEHEPLLRSSILDDNAIDSLNITALALRQRLFVAYKHTKWNFFGIFLTFVCTLSLFPAYMSKIQPAYPSIDYPHTLWTDRLYTQVMTFLLFNVGDTLGRMISAKIQIPSILRSRLLFFICLLRFIFIPLFGLCHFPNTNGFPYVFKNDFIYASIVLLFSLSHGYCNSLNMMYAPRRVHAQLSSTVGALMLMALTFGIFVGSLLSYGVVALYGDAQEPDNIQFQ